MAPADLLSLPPELLDKVYSYLDWNLSESLCPSRPNIISISLTCRRLRASVLPTLFKHVVLKLRWYRGVFIEPALFRLRRARPDLARHVSSVYINADLYRSNDARIDPIPFNIPEDLSDWICPGAANNYSEEFGERLHRQRAEAVAQRVFEGSQSLDTLSVASRFIQCRIGNFRRHILHEGALELANVNSVTPMALYSFQNATGKLFQGDAAFEGWDDRRYLPPSPTVYDDRQDLSVMTLRLDALVVAILCLPAHMTSLTFSRYPRGHKSEYRNNFAMNVAAGALQIFGHRLQRLGMISEGPDPLQHGLTRMRSLDDENSVFTHDVLSELTGLKTLTLSKYDLVIYRLSRSPQMALETKKWTQLGATVRHLELHKCHWETTELLQFLQDFEKLQTLALKEFKLHELPVQAGIALGETTLWLKTLIELRRRHPELELQLSITTVPPSSIRWLLNEAVPTGCTISFDREDRLTEDFESFRSLWKAEDGARGIQAREARKDGRLVDEAMANR